MDRTQKEQLIAELNKEFKSASAIVVLQQSGVTVAEVSDVRRKARAANAQFRVAKNTLARIALKGTQFEGIASMFKGTTAVAYSADPVAAAKLIVGYAKINEKISIVGGAMGSQLLDKKGIEALATLPSLEELRAKIIGMLQTPATRVAGVLQAPAGQLARVVSAYSKTGTGV